MIPDRLEPVLTELRPLADRFAAAGHRLYLVGGTVRDLLLDRQIVGDYDLTTDARPAEIKRILDGWANALWTQGERFGTIGEPTAQFIAIPDVWIAMRRSSGRLAAASASRNPMSPSRNSWKRLWSIVCMP